MSDSPEEEVTTRLLDWFPKEGVGELRDIRTFAQQYGVGFIIPASMMNYGVRLVGPYENVYKAIAENWCANEVDGSRSKDWYIRGLMGDDEAMKMWEAHDASDEVAFNVFDFAWEVHWKNAGETDQRSEQFDAATEAAIEMLASAGYQPSDGSSETEHTDFAQSYLTLAFLHCPKLVDTLPPMEVPQSDDRWWHGDGSECHDIEISRYTNPETGHSKWFCDQHDERVYQSRGLPPGDTLPL